MNAGTMLFWLMLAHQAALRVFMTLGVLWLLTRGER